MSDWWPIVPLIAFATYILADIFTSDGTSSKKYKNYTMVDADNNVKLFIDTLSYDEKKHIIMNWYLLNCPEQSVSEANSFALGKMIDDDDGNTKYFLKQLLHYNRTL